VERKLKNFKGITLTTLFLLAMSGRAPEAGAAEAHQHNHKAASGQAVKGKEPRETTLFPAEGGRVKILAPKGGQTVKGDQVPLEFKLVKGKKGEHVHAYVGNSWACSAARRVLSTGSNRAIILWS
jgi:hypothetical protein